MKKKWIIILIIGFIPIIISLGLGVFCAFFGFQFFNQTSYGIQAFFDCLLIIAVLYWPILIVGIILAGLAIYKLHRLKKSKLR